MRLRHGCFWLLTTLSIGACGGEAEERYASIVLETNEWIPRRFEQAVELKVVFN